MISVFGRLRNRIVAIICLVSTAIAFMTGCSANSQVKTVSQIKIGVSVYDDYDAFLSWIMKSMAEYCKDKERELGITITLDIVSAAGSQMTQNDQISKFIAKDYDVVCVNLVDRTDPTFIIDKAKAKDVPVIFFNRELVKEDMERWDKIFYVGADAKQSGEMQAQIIIDALSDPKKFDEIDVNHNGIIQYVMLEGEMGHQDAMIRTQTCIDELKKAGFYLEKIDDEMANWNRDEAATKMRRILDKYPIQIEMIIANNDEMALGALKAVEEKKTSITPYIIGIDGTEDAIEAVRTRKLDGTVYNDADGQAEAIMKLAIGMAMDGKVPDDIKFVDGKYVFLEYAPITYDNVQNYIN